MSGAPEITGAGIDRAELAELDRVCGVLKAQQDTAGVWLEDEDAERVRRALLAYRQLSRGLLAARGLAQDGQAVAGHAPCGSRFTRIAQLVQAALNAGDQALAGGTPEATTSAGGAP